MTDDELISNAVIIYYLRSIDSIINSCIFINANITDISYYIEQFLSSLLIVDYTLYKWILLVYFDKSAKDFIYYYSDCVITST